jgi:hypothetical protein
MRRVELSHPRRAFTAPEREALVEVLIVIAPDPTTPPDEVEAVLEEVVDRADRALAGVFDDLGDSVRVDDIGISSQQHVPVFPANIAGVTYPGATEVYEAIDRLRDGTPLHGILYDSAGRAFEPTVWCSFRRVAQDDRPVSEVWSLERTATRDSDGG